MVFVIIVATSFSYTSLEKSSQEPQTSGCDNDITDDIIASAKKRRHCSTPVKRASAGDVSESSRRPVIPQVNAPHGTGYEM